MQHDDRELARQVVHELERICPRQGLSLGSDRPDLNLHHILDVLRAIPDGAGQEAIVQALARRFG